MFSTLIVSSFLKSSSHALHFYFNDFIVIMTPKVVSEASKISIGGYKVGSFFSLQKGFHKIEIIDQKLVDIIAITALIILRKLLLPNALFF